MTLENKKKNRLSRDSGGSQFDGLFREHYSKLKGYVSRFVKSPHDVEDIVQEAFVRSYEAQKKTEILNMRAYFYTAARNLSFKHNAKHDNKLTDYIEDLGLTEVLNSVRSIEKDVQAFEQFGIFCKAVRGLPLQCRRVFILKRVYGLSQKEISQRLKISVSTVNQHLAKGMARCTQYMEKKGYLEHDQGGADERESV